MLEPNCFPGGDALGKPSPWFILRYNFWILKFFRCLLKGKNTHSLFKNKYLSVKNTGKQSFSFKRIAIILCHIVSPGTWGWETLQMRKLRQKAIEKLLLRTKHVLEAAELRLLTMHSRSQVCKRYYKPESFFFNTINFVHLRSWKMNAL